MISGKFAITTHILTLLAKFPEEYLASDYIAGSLNIHPVLVRKEIANLKKNHLVESREGKYGGTKLLKSPEAISMEEIFNITFEKVNFGFSKNDPNPLCPVGKQINTNLTHLYDDINDSIISKLKTISLAEFSEKF
ncbi:MULTISPECIES: Rrf2 family transcriptional regulator [Flavobacterium]|uniref:RrF2 family transcriptional regulator n=1 Tax=Flavobacterium TaxID=237 RepID=UPI00086F9BE8|nr:MULTISPECIES: Rrf2 family transcriptional regulator [Flavobacterium]MBN9285680.1 Rrf2 family transcriptional regulator [Flavobacterium sp.]ODS81411.1 MAG: Rrf2 family transcriptional regulator [Chryseobacterium sp. SCN 40-13]OJV70570.1 MAG: transcriptional regulator [Flavobacterium sp. 40-81]